MERDRLVLFINKLILHKRNVRELTDMGGIRILVDLLTLAHLHISRAVIPTQTNVIEGSADMQISQEKEWYYNIDKTGRQGPVSFQEVFDLFIFENNFEILEYFQMKELHSKGVIDYRTKCWAMGLDGWRALAQIPQLKWCLVAKGAPVLNESDLAINILNILIKMCEYFPSR